VGGSAILEPLRRAQGGFLDGAACKECKLLRQYDGFLGWVERRQRELVGCGLLVVHLFVGGDELPAPGFGEVFEIWVLGADQV
jgi:hypothetical protein